MRSSDASRSTDNGGKKPTLLILLVVFIVVAIAGIIVDFVLDKNGVIAFISLLAVFLLISGFLIFEVIRRRKSKTEASNAAKSEDQRFLRHYSPESSGFDENDFRSSAWGGEVINSRRVVETGFEEDDEEDENDYRRAFSQNSYSTRVFESDPQPEPEDIVSGFEQSDDSFELPEEEPEIVLPQKREPEYMSMPASQAPPRRSFLFGKKTPEEETVQLIPENIPEAPVEPEPVAQPEPEPVERPFANYRRTHDEPQEKEEPAKTPEEEFKPVELPKPQNTQPAVSAASTPAQSAVKSAPMGFVEGQSLESFYSEMSEEDILYKDCVEVWAAAAKPCVLRMMKYIESIEDKRTASLFGRECEYINAMLDRIYYFTEMDDIENQLDLRKFNFSTLVMECLKRFSPFFTERKLGLLWKGLDIEVMTDRRWFVFALTQIVFNCVEFTPQGGKIAISARKSGDFVELCIDDSGCGIKSEELPFVFMAGFMSDDAPNPENTRTGMGLFIARNVVRKMGGDVFAESNPGKGTRIIMRMPTGIR